MVTLSKRTKSQVIVFIFVGFNLEMQHTSTYELRKAIREGSKALNLEGKRLLRISDKVTELKEVEILNLSHNELAKLPRSTSNLRNLTTLNLNHNKLTQFPEVVITLINLRHLFLNDNQLSTLPANIKNLEKLEEYGSSTLAPIVHHIRIHVDST